MNTITIAIIFIVIHRSLVAAVSSPFYYCQDNALENPTQPFGSVQGLVSLPNKKFLVLSKFDVNMLGDLDTDHPLIYKNDLDLKYYLEDNWNLDVNTSPVVMLVTINQYFHYVRQQIGARTYTNHTSLVPNELEPNVIYNLNSFPRIHPGTLVS